MKAGAVEYVYATVVTAWQRRVYTRDAMVIAAPWR